MHFSDNSLWQTFAIMMPLDKLNESAISPKLRKNLPHAVPHIRFVEFGPIPSDILRCCEAAWDCTFEGIKFPPFKSIPKIN